MKPRSTTRLVFAALWVPPEVTVSWIAQNACQSLAS